MARRRYDDEDDDYEYDSPAPRPRSPIGAGIGLGALAGLVSGEGVLIFAGMDFMKNVMGPAAAWLMMGLCFLVVALAPVFVLLGICGGVATAKTRSTVFGIVIGALSGPALVFILWACGAISIRVNNQPVEFNLSMALWCSAFLWIPGAVGALFTGLIALGESNAPPDRPRRRRRPIDDDDRDRPRRRGRDEDDRRRERRRDDDDDEDEDRPRRRWPD